MDDTRVIDAVILCGGLGQRLRSTIGESQKTMAKVADQPFLDFILQYLKDQGFQRLVLCTGYQADQVQEHYRGKKFSGAEIIFSQEQQPLGTGGAVKNAQKLITSNPFVLLNGDSFCRIDYHRLLEFHDKQGALLTMVVAPVADTQDYGTIIIEEHRIVGFREKEARATKDKGPFYVNVGIYVCDQRVWGHMPQQEKFSLEKDFFPQLLKEKVFGFVVNEEFLDIGTPARYESAEQVLRQHKH
ncbi:MAG: nucleotidyltransferase family protein [Candidatus Omnitrophica bacterium]|nr:nucleotidyltransferase family protein [Candidatus Omnitrophota bacterium]